ncbi:uncharacterized protein At2g39795, mitochondrial [Elaeis guineensis]
MLPLLPSLTLSCDWPLLLKTPTPPGIRFRTFVISSRRRRRRRRLRRAAAAAMAFSIPLRRALSAVFPRAIRFLGRSYYGGHHSALLRPMYLEGIVCRSTIGERTPLSFPSLALFSSATKKPASDANLLRIIDDEIKYAEDSDDHGRVEEIPEGFPFEIQNEKEMNVITLKRSYQGEKIEVVVSMPSLVTGEEPNNDMEDDHDEDEGGGRGEKPSQSSIPLTVNVSKGDGPSLEFCCTAYPDEVTIDSMSVSENKESDEEMIAYEGPDFNDLDENLQKAFHKYLEIRGISPMTTNFLHEYMINKDSREYLHWLRNFKQFVQK